METDTNNIEEMKKNDEERLDFVKFWANYIKTHEDKDWSQQQNIVINSQFNNRC